jgi:3-phenylpropionate/trans-cinnamate dioxygenase ferredoxin component
MNNIVHLQPEYRKRRVHRCGDLSWAMKLRMAGRRRQVMTSGDFVAVARLDEVPLDGSKPVDVGGLSILLCNHEGRIYALENRCSHAEQPLECGRVKWGWIACPFHGTRFDLETGEPLNPPATEPVRTFAVRVENGMIQVAL